MALTATMYRFQIELADIDRSVYESLDLRVAAHPSEDAQRVVVRVLARGIAHEDGLEFGRGLSHTEDPALLSKTPTGEISTWIDIGQPSAERLHRASKRAQKLLIVTDKHAAPLHKEWSSRSIHKAEDIELIRLPKSLVNPLAESLERTMQWYVTLQEGGVSVSGAGGADRSIDGAITRGSLADFLKNF